MDSFNPLSSSSTSSFSSYTDSSPDPHSHESSPFPAMLDIYVHQARNIHNICIYANQDVYAKFSLTCSPDDILSTQIIKGGGRNPDFNELLHLPIPHRDAVLKCEIWMLSRARNYLDDQLLGFTLVPLSLLPLSHHPHPKLTQDFTLSSTDLFHSPAGTVQLTLSLDTCSQPSCNSSSVLSFQDSGNSTSTITSEVVLLNPDEYKRIEFPDIGVAKENQLMVSEYFSIAPPFLHLASSSPHPHPHPQSLDDYDMTKNGAAAAAAATTEESFQHSAATSLSDDRKSQEESKNGNEEDDDHDKECEKLENEELGSVFKSPLGNINFEEEQSVMQQQIVDMYMRSMQQFTESLAKMKLPMDLDNPKVGEDGADMIQSEDKSRLEALNNNKKKKDGSRVFYGSRAFF